MIDFSKIDPKTYMKDLGIDLPCPLIASDDGYAQNNLAYWVMKDGKLTIEETKIQSRGRRGRHATSMQGKGVGLFSTGDEFYTVRDTIEYEDTRRDDYPTSSLNRYLVHAALNKIGMADNMPVALVTGLPLKVYMPSHGEVNERVIGAKTENMMTPVSVGLDRTPSAKVVYHAVLPEAIAGIGDYLIDNSGQPREGVDMEAVRMGLDIGGNTTDMVIIMPGNEIAAFDTIPFGVSHMADRLRKRLEDRFEMTLDSMTLDDALHKREVSLFGDEPKDVSKEWQDAVNDVLVDIFAAADSFRKKYPSLREMVCFGGGAALCEDVIRTRFPAVKMVDNPDGANARGYLKFATLDSLDVIRESLQGVDLYSANASATEPA